MNKNVFVLVNPASGRKNPRRVLDRLEKRLVDLRIDHQVYETSAASRGFDTVRDNLSDGHSDIIVIGGDGTLNEAVNALSQDIPLGIIPSGTGNDYAKCLDIGKDESEVINNAINGEIARVDLGLCNGRRFLNGVGIGIDGEIVFDMLYKKTTLLKGHARYYYRLLNTMLTYRAQSIRYRRDDGAFKESRLMSLTVAKGTTFGGGFRLTPTAKLQDGYLHLCEIASVPLLKRFLQVGKVKKGTHLQLEEVAFYRARTLAVDENAALHAHVDGEYLGPPPFSFSVLPGALAVRVKSTR